MYVQVFIKIDPVRYNYIGLIDQYNDKKECYDKFDKFLKTDEDLGRNMHTSKNYFRHKMAKMQINSLNPITLS